MYTRPKHMYYGNKNRKLFQIDQAWLTTVGKSTVNINIFRITPQSAHELLVKH